VTYEVLLADDAENDLLEIYRYVAFNDSLEKADQLLDKLEELVQALDSLPTRGHIPPELVRIGVTDYREVHFKPYRVIYRIEGQRVLVYCVLDGRRDLQSLLQQRLLR
jgi:toxin ParE1/3/4